MLSAKFQAKIRRNLITGLACSGVFLSVQSRPAEAANPVTTVTVNDVDYDVTYFTGSYDNNPSKFTTADMPWWGDKTLAQTFADKVSLSLGKPNPPPPTEFGPRFAFILSDDDGDFSVESFADYGGGAQYGGENTDNTSSYATAKVSASTAVPGPLPLGGAVAVFGMSRRLRSRLRQSR